jgi:hypothetical protein
MNKIFFEYLFPLALKWHNNELYDKNIFKLIESFNQFEPSYQSNEIIQLKIGHLYSELYFSMQTWCQACFSGNIEVLNIHRWNEHDIHRFKKGFVSALKGKQYEITQMFINKAVSYHQRKICLIKLLKFGEFSIFLHLFEKYKQEIDYWDLLNFNACQNGDIGPIKFIIKQCPIESKDLLFCKMGLDGGCKHGSLACAQYFLNHINTEYVDILSSFTYALKYGNVDVMNLLYSKLPFRFANDPILINKFLFLLCQCSKNIVPMCHFLDRFLRTCHSRHYAFFGACASGNVKRMEATLHQIKMIENSYIPDINFGLNFACATGSLSCVKYILSMGTISNFHRYECIMTCIKNNHYVLFKYLMELFYNSLEVHQKHHIEISCKNPYMKKMIRLTLSTN